MVDWIPLLLVCAAIGTGWDFDTWKRAHTSAEPMTSTSQRGKAELEPLLAATGSEPEVRDRAVWERRRAPFERALRAILGALPAAKPPLEVRILEKTEEPSWVRRKVAYSGEQGETITAYLFIPRKRAKRAPAMICLHQTVRPGKREASGLEGDASLAFAPQLAERGYVTLAPDASGSWSKSGASTRSTVSRIASTLTSSTASIASLPRRGIGRMRSWTGTWAHPTRDE
jgi:hypothetical protein